MNDQRREQAIGELKRCEELIGDWIKRGKYGELTLVLATTQGTLDTLDELLREPGSSALALGWSNGPEGIRFCEVRVELHRTPGPERADCVHGVGAGNTDPWESIGQRLLLALVEQETERSEGQRLPWWCMPLVCWYAIARYIGGRDPGKRVLLGADTCFGLPCMSAFTGRALYPATRVIVDGQGATNAAGFEWECASFGTVLQYIEQQRARPTADIVRMPDLLTLDHAAVQMPDAAARVHNLTLFEERTRHERHLRTRGAGDAAEG